MTGNSSITGWLMSGLASSGDEVVQVTGIRSSPMPQARVAGEEMVAPDASLGKEIAARIEARLSGRKTAGFFRSL